jgi:microcystin-dependent protein
MYNQKSKINTILSIIAGLITVASLYGVTAVFAQINSIQGSNTTIIGDVTIPANSNDTKTSVANNATNSTISTAIDKASIAKNITSAVIFTKEDPTTPISPTGISTQGLHQPPQHRLVNNSASDAVNWYPQIIGKDKQEKHIN